MNTEQAAHEEAIIACTHPLDLPEAVLRYRALADVARDSAVMLNLLEYAFERAAELSEAAGICKRIATCAKSRKHRGCALLRAAKNYLMLGMDAEADAAIGEAENLVPELFAPG